MLFATMIFWVEFQSIILVTLNLLDICSCKLPMLVLKIYLKENGDSLNYLAGFYLHIEEIDSTHTKVSIMTIDPKVVLRRELLPSLPHMVRMDKTMSVDPSTIEEYGILLEIGRLVGEKDMPSIYLPEKKLK